VEEGTRIYTRKARWSSLLTARSRRMSLFGIVWHCSTRLAWGVRYCRSMSRARDRCPGQRQRMTRPLVAGLEDMADERQNQTTSRCFHPRCRGRPLVKKYMAPYRHRGRPPWRSHRSQGCLLLDSPAGHCAARQAQAPGHAGAA
jgi:hypothetical protein